MSDEQEYTVKDFAKGFLLANQQVENLKEELNNVRTAFHYHIWDTEERRVTIVDKIGLWASGFMVAVLVMIVLLD